MEKTMSISYLDIDRKNKLAMLAIFVIDMT